MPKNLLVADDSVVIQKSIGITFAQEDFSITYVTNGNDAVIKAKQLKPDCILADVVMPTKSGYDVCQSIKQDPQLKTIPVILLAGSTEPYDEARGKSVGAEGYIIKPFESQALIDRVNDAIVKGKGGAATAPTPPPPAARPTPPTPPPMAAQAAATPSPASTIAGQSPISRDAPALDLDISASEEETISPAASSFELALDEPTQVVDTGASAADEAPADEPATLPGGDFWDLPSTPAAGEASSDSPAPTAEPADANAWGTISAGSWEDVEKTPAPPEPMADTADPELAIETPTPAPSSTPSDEFGFDLSSGGSDGAAISDSTGGATFDFSAPESAPVAAEDEPNTSPVFKDSAAAPAVSLSDQQIEAIVAKVFQKVIERIAWEVVPDLAETIIKEELTRLTQEKS